MTNNDGLEPLRAHPVFTLVKILAANLGIGRDLILVIELLSLTAGKMGMPINLEIATDQITADLFIANSILGLLEENVSRVETYRQFQSIERAEFDDMAAVLLRGDHRSLYRLFAEITSCPRPEHTAQPSLWKISDRVAPVAASSTVRVVAMQVARDLDGFAAAFAVPREMPARARLTNTLAGLPTSPGFECPFRSLFRGSIPTDAMLIVERLLQVFVALRLAIASSTGAEQEVSLGDYAAVRALLQNLPVVPTDRGLSPQALVLAESVWSEVNSSRYALELPDRSGEGGKWFTRSNAQSWTNQGYNTVKKRIQELEDEGILVSTVAQNNRDHGRIIHYRFHDGCTPPFNWTNPFAALPEAPNAS